MANGYSTQPLTGCYGRKQVPPVSEVLMLPIVREAASKDKTNVVNDATKSGKQKGAMVCLEVTSGALKIAIAVDGKEDSEWKSIITEDSITPA